jgi:hypothetical protein
LHLPERWHRQQEWLNLFESALATYTDMVNRMWEQMSLTVVDFAGVVRKEGESDEEYNARMERWLAERGIMGT